MVMQPLKIGLDFDNTIVCYDEAIALLAERLFELPPHVLRTKRGIRDHLRACGREPEWTQFQGALYGPGMEGAKPFAEAIETMQKLVSQGHQLMIVSHRTRVPYAGPPYDLHAAARIWVSQHLQAAGLFLPKGEDATSKSTVSFLETRKAKVAKISELGCRVFVDDLPEVLEESCFPKTTVGILFAPSGERNRNASHHTISAWHQLPDLLDQLWP